MPPDAAVNDAEAPESSEKTSPKESHPQRRLPGIVSFLFENLSADELLAILDMHGLAASAGSACTAGSNEPSHVLGAMGLLTGERQAPLRLSLGRYTGEAEAGRALLILCDVVRRLRQ